MRDSPGEGEVLRGLLGVFKSEGADGGSFQPCWSFLTDAGTNWDTSEEEELRNTMGECEAASLLQLKITLSPRV